MSPAIPNDPDGAPSPIVADPRRRRRWRLFRIVMILLILIGQEALFRLLFPVPEIERFNRVHYQELASRHPNYGRTMAGGLVYDRLLLESSPDGFAEVHGLNLHGFRGPDFAIEPDPQRRRILTIGDSVTEGMGADDASSFPAVWSRLLAEDGISAEVINLGVMGTGLPQYWLLLRDSIALLKPADIVVMLYANDLPAPGSSDAMFNASSPEFTRADDLWRKPRLAVLIDRLIVEKPIHRWWPQFPNQSRFFAPAPDSSNPWSGNAKRPDGLSERLYQAMVAGKLNPFVHFQAKMMPGALAYNFAEWGSPKTFLEHMAEVCRSHGVRLIVGYAPFCGVVHARYAEPLAELGMDPESAGELSTDPKYRSQNRIVAEVCAELNLPLIDVTDALEAAEAAGHPQYWQYDSHPNADGYATIAARVHAAWRSATGDGSSVQN